MHLVDPRAVLAINADRLRAAEAARRTTVAQPIGVVVRLATAMASARTAVFTGAAGRGRGPARQTIRDVPVPQ